MADCALIVPRALLVQPLLPIHSAFVPLLTRPVDVGVLRIHGTTLGPARLVQATLPDLLARMTPSATASLLSGAMILFKDAAARPICGMPLGAAASAPPTQLGLQSPTTASAHAWSASRGTMWWTVACVAMACSTMGRSATMELGTWLKGPARQLAQATCAATGWWVSAMGRRATTGTWTTATGARRSAWPRTCCATSCARAAPSPTRRAMRTSRPSATGTASRARSPSTAPRARAPRPPTPSSTPTR
eukprot:23018-Rhodomonas_salina.1